MKVTLKNLAQQTFTVDIDDSKTVLELKQKIADDKGTADYKAECQKLIYAGKILVDDATLAEAGYEEGKFIVVMLTKPKPTEASPPAPAPQPAAAAAATAAATTTASTPASTETSTTESQPATTTAPSTEAAASGTSLNISSAESNLVLGSDYTATINRLVDMGYPRSEVERAMRASFNNPDRAVEYLLSGIPPTEQDAPVSVEPQRGGQAAPAQEQLPTGGGGGGGGGANPLDFLRNQPQFQQMREVLAQNPSLLPTIMQQIGNSNPDLLRLITENQQAFIEMINQAEGSDLGGQGGAGGPDLSSYMGTASITQADKEAIERLKALGFAEYLVVQAYFACNKDENMAADFLLSQGDDD